MAAGRFFIHPTGILLLWSEEDLPPEYVPDHLYRLPPGCGGTLLIRELPRGFVPGGRSAGERIPPDRFFGHKISGNDGNSPGIFGLFMI